MKATFAVILFLAAPFLAAPVFAQNQPLVASAEAACGPEQEQFNAKAVKNQAAQMPTQPEAGKSLVYVVEVFDKDANQIGRPTLRVGMDGKWMGADKSDSYLSFSVDPGEHHLCTRWQSSLKRLSDKLAFAGLSAEAGKTYYFRARIIESGYNFALDFEPVNEDEGKYLVASSAMSVSNPKK